MIYPQPNYVERIIEHYAYDDEKVTRLNSITFETVEIKKAKQYEKAAFWLADCVVDFLSHPDLVTKNYHIAGERVTISAYSDGVLHIYFPKIADKTLYICVMVTQMLCMDGRDTLDVGYWTLYSW